MSLVEKIISLYPELTINDFMGLIQIKDDGNGAYIYAWNHPTLPRPTDEELA